MWWAILCFTVALIACNSATIQLGENTIDHIHQNTPDNTATILTTDNNLNTDRISNVDEEVPGILTDTSEDNTSSKETSEDQPVGESSSGTSEDTSEETVEVQNPPTDTDTREDTKEDTNEDVDSAEMLSSETTDTGSYENSASVGIHSEITDGSDNLSKDSNAEEPGNEDLIVTTKSGEVQGYIWQDKENIVSYIDIPYGTIEELFQAATPAQNWASIHSAKDHNKRCPQLNGDTYVGEIDCLALSIFKPINAQGASVLFHIHADNFATGSGDPSIYGPEYLVSNGIILVLPNYRLGPLGFLCLQNQTAPGNMALKDLTLALSWIKNNIEAFGGNPENIAVSGEGRSGALAGLLALYPKSKDYVSKVIAESGSFLSYWALDRDPVATADELIDRILDEGDSMARVDISLPDLAVRAIVMAAKGLEFKPCLEVNTENAFMTLTPHRMLTTETFEKITFLLGSATFAGVHEALRQTEDSINKINEDVSLLLPNDLRFNTVTSRRQVGEQVKKQYFGDDDISLADVKDLSLCFTDMGYLGPGIRSARLLVAAGATVYFYEFAYVGELNRVLQSVNHAVDGAVGGDIIGYLFTQDGVMPGEEHDAESKMVASLTEMWTNFLKSGSPSIEGIEWNSLENVDEDEEEWLLIDAEPSMKKGLHMERLPLWTEIYQNHFIEGSGPDLSPSVYTVLIFQLIFWFGFCKNAAHIY